MAVNHLTQYAEQINDFDDQEFLYGWLIDLGKELSNKKKFHIRDQINYVNGCQSQVWLAGSSNNGRWTFLFETDGFLVYGIGKIVLDTFNDLTAAEIKNITYHDFKPIAAVLSSQRQRGLQAIINKIHTLVG